VYRFLYSIIVELNQYPIIYMLIKYLVFLRLLSQYFRTRIDSYLTKNYISPQICSLLYNYSMHKGIFFPMALTALTGPWPLLQFRKKFFTQTARLLGRVISPSQGRYLYTGQHKHRINAYTDIHALSGFRTHDPSLRATTVIGYKGINSSK
jgi:hypothetical protein